MGPWLLIRLYESESVQGRVSGLSTWSSVAAEKVYRPLGCGKRRPVAPGGLSVRQGDRGPRHRSEVKGVEVVQGDSENLGCQPRKQRIYETFPT
jgi:hypothetical protein